MSNPTLAWVESQCKKKSPRSDVCVVPLADVSVALLDDEAAAVVPDALFGGSTCNVRLDRSFRFPG